MVSIHYWPHSSPVDLGHFLNHLPWKDLATRYLKGVVVYIRKIEECLNHLGDRFNGLSILLFSFIIVSTRSLTVVVANWMCVLSYNGFCLIFSYWEGKFFVMLERGQCYCHSGVCCHFYLYITHLKFVLCRYDTLQIRSELTIFCWAQGLLKFF